MVSEMLDRMSLFEFDFVSVWHNFNRWNLLPNTYYINLSIEVQPLTLFNFSFPSSFAQYKASSTTSPHVSETEGNINISCCWYISPNLLFSMNLCLKVNQRKIKHPFHIFADFHFSRKLQGGIWCYPLTQRTNVFPRNALSSFASL